MRALKAIGRVISGIVIALLAVILLCNVYTIAARKITGEPQPALFGWSCAVVLSGSMEPELRVDDLILVHAEDTYAVGDVISYESGGSVVTHRIVAERAGQYVTKGDANNTEDTDPVSPENVVGKVTAVIPGAGRVIGFFQTPLGLMCLVLVCLVLIELPSIAARLSGKREEEDVP